MSNEAHSAAEGLSFPPQKVVNCDSEPRFRSQLARDLSCLFDADPEIVSWRCLAGTVTSTDHEGIQRIHVPDFHVYRLDGTHSLVDALPAGSVATQTEKSPLSAPVMDPEPDYRVVREEEIRGGYKLMNVKDLLDACVEPGSLEDRIKLLALLDACGPLQIIECVQSLMMSTSAISIIAYLYFKHQIIVDLEDSPIGPETLIWRP
ncbi:hypothetical protein [Fodinicurvata halophila]|uniref:hypothetical protein n=1 Tax=Fodinicurvata halophila TaxID=1419723 RepID=UPI0036268F98